MPDTEAEDMNCSVNFTLTEAMRRSIRMAAAAENLSTAEWCRRVINRALQEDK